MQTYLLALFRYNIFSSTCYNVGFLTQVEMALYMSGYGCHPHSQVIRRCLQRMNSWARILTFLVIHQFWWHVYYSYSFNLLFLYFSTWCIWALIILLSLFFGGCVEYLLCFTTHFVPQSTGFIRPWTALTVKPINSRCQRLIIVTIKCKSCTIPVKWGLQSSLNHRM